MLTYARDKQTKDIITTYPPRIKVVLEKSRNNTGDFNTQVYTRETGRLPIKFDVNNFTDTIPKGSYVRPIIELQKLWFSAMGFGCKWRLFQGRVYKDTSSVVTDVTGGSSDEEDDEELSDYESKQRKKRKTETCAEENEKEKDDEGTSDV